MVLATLTLGTLPTTIRETLLNFVENNFLKIANTFFEKRKSKKWTWLSLDGNTKNEIDFFIIDDTRIVEDISKIDLFKFPSDHRAMKMKIKIPKRFRITKFKKSGTERCTQI